MPQESEIAVAIRPAQRSDLDAINAVVDAAVMSWARADHVKPAALPDYNYRAIDLDRCMLLLVVGSHKHILGVAACCCAEPMATEPGPNPLRLDGPYIHPAHHHQGIGAQILAEAGALARRQGRDGLLLEPRIRDSGFLHAMGMPQSADDPPGDAAHWQRQA